MLNHHKSVPSAKKFVHIVQRESQVDLNELVAKFIPEIIGKEIEKATQGIYPLQNVFIRKVKTLRAPKVDVGKLLESHGGADAAVSADAGKPVERAAEKKDDKKKAAPAKKA